MNERTSGKQLISCEECGLVVSLPILREGEKANCPRCDHLLTFKIKHPYQRPIAYAIASLTMLLLSISFPFMSFSVQGLTQEITLLHAVKILDAFQNTLLASLFFATVILLPACYISLMLYLYLAVSRRKRHATLSHLPSRTRKFCKILFYIEPWLMVDVFLIGVLVSLVKIASLADIHMGSSFWAFCVYTVLVVKCVSLVDRKWLWDQLIEPVTVPGVNAGDTHWSKKFLSCHICSHLNPYPRENYSTCIRCGSLLHPTNFKKNLQHVWAFLITASIFYLPANLYPMMYTVSLGTTTPSTIMGGIVLLWNYGSYPVAAIIFIASILIPLVKMFTLAWLFLSVHRPQEGSQANDRQRLRIYRFTEFIGRWSMIDIFVVAILVALVQLHNLMTIYPGPAALSFASVVIFTMLSAMIFDTRMLWPPGNHRYPRPEE
jgi:paraquat-inducible protein A